MQTKTLRQIQTLFKIAKVLSKIVFICCIIGICGCLVGVAGVLIGERSLTFDGVTLHALLQNEAGVSLGTIWNAIVGGLLLCTGELFLSRLAHRCFSHELAAGTPFTAAGAKELLHLGISALWIPFASFVAAQIAQGIITAIYADAELLQLEWDGGIALGLMFIITSLLCRHGAELAAKDTDFV